MALTDELEPIEIDGAIAVVTGGASGIGKGVVKALLRRGATVVIADVEQAALDATVAELSSLGPVEGVVTDVSDDRSFAALADHVFEKYGRCNLLFNNAGVGSGGGGAAWASELNDWKWCFGVNVFGPANGVAAFVPRMIASGEPGQVINTSSGDGGFAPVPQANVYAASKAAVSCFTESLHHQLRDATPNMAASVFYPSGGLMNTGLFTSTRNRPPELARVHDTAGRISMSFDDLKAALEAAGRDVKVADLDQLGEDTVDAVARRQFIVAADIEHTVDLLHRRADAIGRFDVPPHHQMF
jgi:NAD(P)-dependent dehydrogenase (short-subunit alcohol dehydrogenase family)